MEGKKPCRKSSCRKPFLPKYKDAYHDGKQARYNAIISFLTERWDNAEQLKKKRTERRQKQDNVLAPATDNRHSHQQSNNIHSPSDVTRDNPPEDISTSINSPSDVVNSEDTIANKDHNGFTTQVMEIELTELQTSYTSVKADKKAMFKLDE